MVDTKSVADRIVNRYGTRNPFQVANECGGIIIDVPLQGIRGYHQYVHRCHIIYLDSDLSEQDRRWVCAHELGHAVLHKGLNRVFMDTHTHMVSSRYEIEADRFAADFLFSDDMLQEYNDCTIDTVARYLGISCELASYRFQSLKL